MNRKMKIYCPDSESSVKKDARYGLGKRDFDFESVSLSTTFPWILPFKIHCSTKIGDLDVAALIELMEYFEKLLIPSVHSCYQRPVRAANFKKFIAETLMFFHMSSSSIVFVLDRPLYLSKMADLMALYLDVEIKASCTNKENVNKIASRITSALFTYFGNKTEEYLCFIILKLKLISKKSFLLCDLIFRRVFRDAPVSNISCISYIQRLFVFKIWKSIVDEQSLKDMINILALKHLHPPPNFQRRLADNIALQKIIPILPKSSTPMDITCRLLKYQFHSRNKIELFLKLLRDQKVVFYDGCTRSSNCKETNKYPVEIDFCMDLVFSTNNDQDVFLKWIDGGLDKVRPGNLVPETPTEQNPDNCLLPEEKSEVQPSCSENLRFALENLLKENAMELERLEQMHWLTSDQPNTSLHEEKDLLTIDEPGQLTEERRNQPSTSTNKLVNRVTSLHQNDRPPNQESRKLMTPTPKKAVIFPYDSKPVKSDRETKPLKDLYLQIVRKNEEWQSNKRKRTQKQMKNHRPKKQSRFFSDCQVLALEGGDGGAEGTGGWWAQMEAASTTGSTAALVGVGSHRSRLLRLVSEVVKKRTPAERKLIIAVVLLAILTLALLIALAVVASIRRKQVCFTEECVRSAGMLLSNMDVSADPCHDFYRYTCGRWPDNHEVEESSYSWFSDRTKYLNSKVASMLMENATDSDPQPLVEAKSLFASCMDTETLDSLGVEPMLEVLERTGLPRSVPGVGSTSTFRLASVLAKVQRTLSMDLLVQLSLAIDNSTNLTIISVGAGRGGSSLPELVQRQEERSSVSAKDAIALRLAYMAGVMAEVDPEANVTTLPAVALRVLVVDAQIRADIQNSEPANPAKMTFGELQDIMNNVNASGPPKLWMDWSEYLHELMSGLSTQLHMNDTVMVENKDYFIALSERLHRSKPESYQRYIWWNVISSMVPHSTSELRGLRDELYETLFNRPRHTRSFKCAKYVKNFFNMAISYKFASMNSLNETSNKIDWMLKDISRSFNVLVSTLPWIDYTTKEATWKKAQLIKSYIGYPNWLLADGELEKFYKHIEVNDGQFLESMISIKRSEVKVVLETIGNPPSNETFSWLSDPLDVNAYYGRSGNAIAIPAGILQIPFYFLGLEALNYGAIGSILGHELTHAFDIEGKDYDADGKKVSWWSEEMTKEYNTRAQCFVKQYDKFAVTKKNKVNGSLTLAENIADNGGVREALHAYKYYVKRNGMEPYLPGMENYTHEQLFFLAYANVWCEKTSEPDEILSLLDVHTPNKFRVLGTLGNLPEFADAWSCSKNTKMNPENKCVLW